MDARNSFFSFVFFFNATATTEIYTLSLHDALPISPASARRYGSFAPTTARPGSSSRRDRKSTRLNSSHEWRWYAVYCLTKKNQHHGQRGVRPDEERNRHQGLARELI